MTVLRRAAVDARQRAEVTAAARVARKKHEQTVGAQVLDLFREAKKWRRRDPRMP